MGHSTRVMKIVDGKDDEDIDAANDDGGDDGRWYIAIVAVVTISTEAGGCTGRYRR